MDLSEAVGAARRDAWTTTRGGVSVFLHKYIVRVHADASATVAELAEAFPVISALMDDQPWGLVESGELPDNWKGDGKAFVVTPAP